MNILVVEDEPMILKGISFLLKDYEYPDNEQPTIFMANNGVKAIEYLQSNSFDFIFTDIKMPEMNGFELISKWSQKKTISQWVVISGFNDFEYTRQAIQYGVKDYLLKPVTRKKMNETIERLLTNRENTENSFISIMETQYILEKLGGFIWNLDVKAMKGFFSQWVCKLPEHTINLKIYHNFLKEVLEILVSRLKSKGIKDLTNDELWVKGRTKEELERSFIESCLFIIDKIRMKRKGNVIDPIDAAKEFIEQNLEERLNLSDVADKLGFNPTYFSQLFKKETGESFVEFRRKIRMEKAKELLEMDAMRIIDISNEIGYSDLPHFTKSFKKYTGYTPSEYKQRLGISCT
ncbi:response regulator transcription factor [Gracilibacillus salinarum]|uniref:AraC family transcriptional regulator n=1 Tax=Gracilibacillus salinarum TaxID=2932255 RepID=A0ABY4GRA4_9BACI|nr:AraC family transcriptional regulator [Gracilibacillus salinarum]UOQ86921.1 AraC family transcriptional regulator [Gracilibacillus salinarum]